MSPRLRALVLVIVAIAATAASSARAAEGASFDAEQFHPALTSHGYLGVDGAFVAPHLGFSAGLYLSYAHDPLVLRGPQGVPAGGEVISHQLGGDLVATLGLIDRLELGLDLPFVPYQKTDASRTQLSPLRAAGLGDLRLELKALLWAPRFDDYHVGLSVVVGGTAPTGTSSSFMGQGAFTGLARLVGEWTSPWATLAVSFGTVLRTSRDFADLHVTSQLSWGVGLGVPLPAAFGLIGEVRGLVGVALPPGASLTRAEAPAELAAGVRWRARFGLEVVLAGGAGLTRGYGTPDGRLIAGLRFVTPERHAAGRVVEDDSDGDGVPDKIDRCPSEPGTAANAGCPARDRDGDGVPDDRDKCPSEPGRADNDGCPELDSDGDGIPDRFDRCPQQKGVPDLRGCPKPDRDKDGVADSDDRCPDKPGPVENQGCPDFDSDGDGIIDRLDKCPFEPEVFNGVDDDDGCPDAPAALATLAADRIVTSEPVLFEHDGSVVDLRSYKLLSVVAHILNLHPEVLKVRIEGHTDNKGSPLDLLELSRARAAAVRHWLIERGRVDAHRLSAQGYGAQRSIADNKDVAGGAKNRRIEFVIMQKLDTAQ
jgi:outer membrane protein OmpA-like peptidoglycan-associated protein